jgi:hypothetical protein
MRDLLEGARQGLVVVLVAVSAGGSYVPEWTDHNESGPGTTLSSASASVSENPA